MASMSSSSPRSSDRELSEENDSLTEDEKEEERREADEERGKNQDGDAPPKKRRLAGDMSGRQLALRRIRREEKRNTWEAFGPHVPSFAEAAKASRDVLMEFAEDSDVLTEEHASAMRVYMNKKFSVSSTVSYEHFATF